MIMRNIRWLQRLFKDEDPELNRRIRWNDVDAAEPDRQIETRQTETVIEETREPEENGDEEETEDTPLSPKVMRALKALHTSYNPTLKDIVDFAFVGGTMEDH